VGVHTATEDNGRWKFLVNDRALNVLALLAQDRDRYIRDFILPPKLVQEHWKTFPREDGNVVINIRALGKDVALTTSNGDVSIQQYEGDYSALQ
jgi:hypothetical protein